eukprot:scaffold1002_cov117-Isochrysis_galbana.AAC.1
MHQPPLVNSSRPSATSRRVRARRSGESSRHQRWKNACSTYVKVRAGSRSRLITTELRMLRTPARWMVLLEPEKYWSTVLSQPTSS